ncbi:MAG: hypothetical protein J6S21_05835 [Victivallales bacterium]|nr:hypothetical protein [Victivallales bacterium]
MKNAAFFFVLLFCALTIQLSAVQVQKHKVYSAAMKKDVPVAVMLPEGYQAEGTKNYPVLYLLHGAGGSEQAWVGLNGKHERALVDAFQFIIVMPGVQNTWYYDSPVDPSVRYETFCAKELTAWVEKNYRTVADRRARGLAGLSMGGHGAMWLGIRHKDYFGTAVALSGGVDVRPYPGNWNLPQLLGKKHEHPENWESHTVINAAKDLKNGELAIALDCGVDDFFIGVNRALHKQLIKQKVDHDYTERPGVHNSAYWRNAISYTYIFFKKQFETVK